eukprot:PhM_4_TR9255/c0_g1_i1/m.76946
MLTFHNLSWPHLIGDTTTWLPHAETPDRAIAYVAKHNPTYALHAAMEWAVAQCPADVTAHMNEWEAWVSHVAPLHAASERLPLLDLNVLPALLVVWLVLLPVMFILGRTRLTSNALSRRCLSLAAFLCHAAVGMLATYVLAEVLYQVSATQMKIVGNDVHPTPTLHTWPLTKVLWLHTAAAYLPMILVCLALLRGHHKHVTFSELYEVVARLVLWVLATRVTPSGGDMYLHALLEAVFLSAAHTKAAADIAFAGTPIGSFLSSRRLRWLLRVLSYVMTGLSAFFFYFGVHGHGSSDLVLKAVEYHTVSSLVLAFGHVFPTSAFLPGSSSKKMKKEKKAKKE